VKNRSNPASFTRRESLRYLSFGGGSLLLWACGGTSDTAASDAGAGGTAAAGGSAATGGGTGSSLVWATGGTAAMGSDYPDPFPSSVTACSLAEPVTGGPCTEATDRERIDISEGYPGLPTKLVLLVVDAACVPLENAKVKIWHTQIAGSYSGDTPSPALCLMDQSDSAKHYFRGVQTTDKNGRVTFDTCFPGWYPGRTIHIHFTVTVNAQAFTSQLIFDQALVEDIFDNHPEYQPYGQPDTENSTDGVVGSSALSAFTLETARQSDGVLLASKMLVVPL
jgi:protocatechuate 3,4-dioxygenase beta subunit